MTEISLTSEVSVSLVQRMGDDLTIARAARQSTTGPAPIDPEKESPEAIGGLLNYLMKSRHGTPFEAGAITFSVHAPAFVWWEWVRHRIGHGFSLESGRYRQLEPVFWVPRATRKIKAGPDHKSARPSFVEDVELAEYAAHQLRLAYLEAYRRYEDMIEAGVCNEVARAALPFAVYYSGWITVNPRSLMAFLSLRTHEPDAAFPSRPQAEIEEAARICERFLAEGWPLTCKAFCKHGRVAP